MTAKNLEKKEHQQQYVMFSLQKEKGPFKTFFDETVESFKLERQFYHSGALVGRDVHKLTIKQNYERLVSIFNPKAIKTKTGKNTVGNLKTRFKKFAQCYKLFTANRELCPHEVDSLILRCHSYGNWLPVNFPN